MKETSTNVWEEVNRSMDYDQLLTFSDNIVDKTWMIVEEKRVRDIGNNEHIMGNDTTKWISPEIPISKSELDLLKETHESITKFLGGHSSIGNKKAEQLLRKLRPIKYRDSVDVTKITLGVINSDIASYINRVEKTSVPIKSFQDIFGYMLEIIR